MKFELTEANNEAGLAVLKITEGEFNGVEFAFKTVQFHEEEGDDTSCRVNIDFDVLKTPDERSCQDIEKMEPFQEILGKIMNQILEEQIQHNEQQSQSDKSNP